MKGLHDIKSQARYTLRVMRCKGGVATLDDIRRTLCGDDIHANA